MTYLDREKLISLYVQLLMPIERDHFRKQLKRCTNGDLLNRCIACYDNLNNARVGSGFKTAAQRDFAQAVVEVLSRRPGETNASVNAAKVKANKAYEYAMRVVDAALQNKPIPKPRKFNDYTET